MNKSRSKDTAERLLRTREERRKNTAVEVLRGGRNCYCVLKLETTDLLPDSI